MSGGFTDTFSFTYSYRLYFNVIYITKDLIIKIITRHCYQSASIRWAINWVYLRNAWISFIVEYNCLVCIGDIFINNIYLNCLVTSDRWHFNLYEVQTKLVIEIYFWYFNLTNSNTDRLSIKIWHVTINSDVIATRYIAFVWCNLINLNRFLKIKV